MTTSYPVRIERLRGAAIIRVAAKHNLREIAAEIGAGSHIDAARIDENFILRGPGTAADIVRAAKSLMSAAGITKLRKNAVTGLELLFTLPSHSAIDARSFFDDATCWAARHFGVPILSSIVHLDEAVPHCHVLLLPLINGKMNGSDLHGGPAKLAAMQASFHKEVGANYGLIRHAPRKRLSATEREAALECARQHLEKKFAMTVGEIDVLLKPHATDPVALLRGLGIAIDSVRSKSKSFVEIMTSPCEPEPRNPIGKGIYDSSEIAENGIPMDSFPYTCVGKGFDAQSVHANSENRGNAAATSSSSEQSELCNIATCTPQAQQIDGYSDEGSTGTSSIAMNRAAEAPSQTRDTRGASITSGDKAAEKNSLVRCHRHIAEKDQSQSFLRDGPGFIGEKLRPRHPEERPVATIHCPITRGGSKFNRSSPVAFQFSRRHPPRKAREVRRKWPACGSVSRPIPSQSVSVQGGIRDPPLRASRLFANTSARTEENMWLSYPSEGAKTDFTLLERSPRA